MMYCSHCGKEIPTDSEYCPFCGTHVPSVVKTGTDSEKAEPVITEPVRTQQFASEPVRSEKVASTQADLKKDFTTRKTVNEFYKDPGFWGGLLLIGAFFLPFFSASSGSLWDAVNAQASADKIVLLWLIFPVAGLFMLLHSLNILPGFLAIFFTFFALIALIYWGYIILNDKVKYLGSDEMFTIIKTVGLGLWATLLGTILLLFHRRHTKVEVHHTKYVDRTV